MSERRLLGAIGSAPTTTGAAADEVVFRDVSTGKLGKITIDNLKSTSGSGTFTTLTVSGVSTLSDTIVLEGQTVGGGIVNVTAATITLTAALHAGRIVTLNRAAGVTVTLPAATALGDVYTIVIGTAASSNANIIETSAVTEHMTGSLRAVDDDAEGATGFQWNSETNDDTITMDGTATGGKPGDTIIIRDYEATNWTVDGHLTQSGGSEVTPFSAAVS